MFIKKSGRKCNHIFKRKKPQQFNLLQHWFNNLEEQNLKLIQENESLKSKLNKRPKDFLDNTDLESVGFDLEENLDFDENEDICFVEEKHEDTLLNNESRAID